MQGILIALFGLFLFECTAQDCLPGNPIHLSTPMPDVEQFKSLIEGKQVLTSDGEANKILKDIKLCNNQWRAELQQIEDKISTYSSSIQELYRQHNDLFILQNKIKTLEKSLADSKIYFEDTFGYGQLGIYAVLVKKITPDEDQKDWVKKAQQALIPFVLEDLKLDMDNLMTDLTAFTKQEELKKIIKSLEEREVMVGESFLHKMLRTKTFIKHTNNKKGYFLYVVRCIIVSGKAITEYNNHSSIDDNIYVTKITNDNRFKSELLAYNVSEKDLELVHEAVVESVKKLPNLNKFYIDQHKRSIEKWDAHTQKIEDKMEKTKRSLVEKELELIKFCKELAYASTSDNLDQLVEESISYLEEKIEPLYYDWCRLDSNKIISWEKKVTVHENQSNSLISQSAQLILDSKKSFIESSVNMDIEKLQGFNLSRYGAWREVKLIRRLEGIWIYAIPFEDSAFKIIALAKFRIVEDNSGFVNHKAPPTQNANTFTDTRDGQSYKYAHLKDGQTWMIENLNYEANDSWCYDKDSSKCEEYGRLYTWEAANNACPNGWRLPTDEEWKTLAKVYGGYYDWKTTKQIGNSEKSYQTLIKDGDSKFAAQPGGYRGSNNYFSSIDTYGSYWSGTPFSRSSSWGYDFRTAFGGLLGRYRHDNTVARSCRCIRGEAPVQNEGALKDERDGQTYQWVRLKDGKKWMTQNLNFDTDDSWCYDNNDKNCKKYGRLYTWEAAQKVCPNGWRLPSDEDWWKMTNYYGKAFNEYLGQQKNEGANSGRAVYQALKKDADSKFSAQLGGIRNFLGKKETDHLSSFGYYWTSSEYSPSGAWNYDFTGQVRRFSGNKNWAISCRCVQN